jgi:tRNA-binding EMAP/Myf-like protein
MEKKSNHQVNVVRVSEIIKHPNADTLGLVHIGGYQVVVKLADWKVGDQ